MPPVSTEWSEPFPGEARRAVMVDRDVAILRRSDGDVDGHVSGWLLIAMRGNRWYTVEYAGTLEQADNLARDLAAPNLVSHEMRTSFELRRVNLTAELTEATGQPFIEVPLLNVEWVPDDSVFVVGNSHRLTLNPGVVVASDAGERLRNERRGRESAYHAAIIEERDARVRRACRDTSESLARRY
ncbi:MULTISPECIES: hypothetical protein [unclassified Aureimonas]|uniref:hypothetical protein n=1 Tax=unclassified Aureimonas TaxID=2615206 RepID=UPI0006FFB5E7|nr:MULTISPECIES: hypothetical protein [unclassified Aureimonas]KQT60573.1 hypothetical protein ASG62_08025 [Aureimonas sp. Leaf427]KQT79448.1 hypothetical protein ASG54_10620 [Aureimonas sp. Leaf460]